MTFLVCLLLGPMQSESGSGPIHRSCSWSSVGRRVRLHTEIPGSPRLNLADSAVHHQVGAGDIRTLIRAEEDGCIRDLHGFGCSPERNRADIAINDFLTVHPGGLPIQDGSVGQPRAERIGANATILELRS